MANAAIRTAADFEAWLREARPGEQVTYYTGHLCYDRESIVTLAGKQVHMYTEPLHTLAATVYGAYERGKIILVQRKVDAFDTDYIAIKRKRPERRHI